jgi:hypothetical protein
MVHEKGINIHFLRSILELQKFSMSLYNFTSYRNLIVQHNDSNLNNNLLEKDDKVEVPGKEIGRKVTKWISFHQFQRQNPL